MHCVDPVVFASLDHRLISATPPASQTCPKHIKSPCLCFTPSCNTAPDATASRRWNGCRERGSPINNQQATDMHGSEDMQVRHGGGFAGGESVPGCAGDEMRRGGPDPVPFGDNEISHARPKIARHPHRCPKIARPSDPCPKIGQHFSAGSSGPCGNESRRDERILPSLRDLSGLSSSVPSTELLGNFQGSAPCCTTSYGCKGLRSKPAPHLARATTRAPKPGRFPLRAKTPGSSLSRPSLHLQGAPRPGPQAFAGAKTPDLRSNRPPLHAKTPDLKSNRPSLHAKTHDLKSNHPSLHRDTPGFSAKNAIFRPFPAHRPPICPFSAFGGHLPAFPPASHASSHPPLNH